MINSIKNKKGFTIVELIIIIVVLGILVLLAAPKLLGYNKDAKLTQIKNDIKVHENVIEVERIRNVDLIEEWEIVDEFILEEYKDSKTLFDKKGVVSNEEELSGEHFKIPSSNLVNTKLKGDFILNEDGKVFYYEEKAKEPTNIACFKTKDNEDNTITIIGYDVDCGGLNVSIPNKINGKSVTNIGRDSFIGHGITSLVIPEGIKFIGDNAFKNNNLKSVIIPKSVEELEGGAFLNNKLKVATILNPKIIMWRYEGEYLNTFYGNDGKVVVRGYVDSTVHKYTQHYRISGHTTFEPIKSAFSTKLTSDKTIEILGYYEKGGKTDKIVIPSEINGVRVTHISRDSFIGYGITSLTISEGIEFIGDNAFRDNNLTSVVIPKSVKEIEGGVFLNNKLKFATILNPDAVMWIYEGEYLNTFYGNDGKVIVRSYVNSRVYRYTQHNRIKGHTTFEPIESGFSTKLTPDNTIEILGYYAKDGKVNEIVIPKEINGVRVTHIGRNAFVDYGITSLTIAEGVEFIGDNAFKNNNLTSVIIPKSVKEIEGGAFLNNKLKIATILNPDTIMWIYEGEYLNTFYGNDGKVIVRAKPGSRVYNYTQHNRIKGHTTFEPIE